jgi:uncharacterized protein (DUF433 family)
MNLREIAVREPDTKVVVFKDTAIAVDHLFRSLAAGNTLDQFLAKAPGVKREQAEALLRLAPAMLADGYHNAVVQNRGRQ